MHVGMARNIRRIRRPLAHLTSSARTSAEISREAVTTPAVPSGRGHRRSSFLSHLTCICLGTDAIIVVTGIPEDKDLEVPEAPDLPHGFLYSLNLNEHTIREARQEAPFF